MSDRGDYDPLLSTTSLYEAILMAAMFASPRPREIGALLAQGCLHVFVRGPHEAATSLETGLSGMLVWGKPIWVIREQEKALVRMRDGRRFTIVVSEESLHREKEWFAIPYDSSAQRDANEALAVGAPRADSVRPVCVYRQGEENGVPVFVER